MGLISDGGSGWWHLGINSTGQPTPNLLWATEARLHKEAHVLHVGIFKS